MRKFIDHIFELHCHCRFSGSWEREISPLGQTHSSQLPEFSCVSRPHFYRLPLTTITPAGFLTVTVYYSRLGLPSLRMVPYRSTPPLLQIVQETITKRSIYTSEVSEPRQPSSPPRSPPYVERKKWGAAGWQEDAQTSAWDDQPGDYLNPLTFSTEAPTRFRLGLANLLVRYGPNSERWTSGM